MPPRAFNLVAWGICALTLWVAALLIWGLVASSKSRGRGFFLGLIGVAAWMRTSAVLANAGVLVPAAIFGHVVITRKLFAHQTKV